MAGDSGWCSPRCRVSFLLLMTIAAQIAVCLFVMHATKIMDDEWPVVLKAHGQRVMVVEMEQFWGPVHVLVPENCKESTQWDKLVTHQSWTNRDRSDTSRSDAWHKRTGHHDWGKAGDRLRHHKKADKDVDEKTSVRRAGSQKNEEEDGKEAANPAGEERKLPALPEAQEERRLQLREAPQAEERELKMIIPRFIRNVSICINGTRTLMDFNGPTYWHRYFSMISLSSMITGGTISMDKLHDSRMRTYRSMFFGLVLVMMMKYSIKLMDILSGCCGHSYVQLWNGGRTTMDKMIESLMIHGISIVFQLAMQLTLCTLFLTFWEGEYFVMSYIPGLGFVMFFGSFVIFTVGMVVDRVKQVMLNAGNGYIITFWFGWVSWMFLICVPMMGYCVYVMQFVFEVIQGHWIQTEPFSQEFVQASRHVCHACGWFSIIAFVELLVVLKMDFEEGKVRSP